MVLRRFLILLISLTTLGGVIYFVEPPKSWQEAQTWQILIFFIPLLVFFTFVANLIFKYLPRSFIVGLGLIMLLVLKASNYLNILTAGLVLLVVVFLVNLLKPSLTRQIKIPKLKNLGGRR